MTTDRIIELAKSAAWYGCVERWTFNTRQQLESFAQAIRAEALEEAAKVCDNQEWWPFKCATSIRALKEIK